jgi:hypothetical protein
MLMQVIKADAYSPWCTDVDIGSTRTFVQLHTCLTCSCCC